MAGAERTSTDPRRRHTAALFALFAAAAALVVVSSVRLAAARRPQLVVWAWERPEDLRFLPAGTDVAAFEGFVELAGPRVTARGRRAPLKLPAGVQPVAVIHVQIDPHMPVQWTPALRAETVAAVLAYARASGSRRVQIDFEVRGSQRQVLLDILGDVRRGLGPRVWLSMTALASWCDTERWLKDAPVDEVAPMLFRMGPRGRPLSARLAEGEDFQERRCRSALGVATDQPPAAAPGAGRRIYLFNPNSWTPAAFAAVRRRIETWPN